MAPVWVDPVMPFIGPCGLCGAADARHRVLDTIAEQVRAGDDPESVSMDFGYPLDFVNRVAKEWAPGSDEQERVRRG